MYLISVAASLFAYTVLPAANILMKIGIGWTKSIKNRDSVFYRNLSIWFIGYVLGNLYIIPNFFALKTLAPHIVAAMSGWSIIMLVVASHFILKERIFPKAYLFGAMIAAGIFILNWYRPVESEPVFRVQVFFAFYIIPISLGFPAHLISNRFRIKPVLLAMTAGSCMCMMLATMDITVQRQGFRVLSYLTEPYFYVFLGSNIVSFLSMQRAYRIGDMIQIGPVFHSTNITLSAILAVLVFGAKIHPAQAAAILVIMYSIARLLYLKEQMDKAHFKSMEGSHE